MAYIKAHIASRILSGMEKETPLLEETLTLSSEGDVEERTVGSETSLTLSGELSDISDNPIECFHSRGQHLWKFIGTKENVCIRKEFNSHRIGLGHQHGRRFIVLGHQYGRRDVM